MEGNTKTKPVVVIGSGFSGAVAADQLVRAGVPVVMLERGPWRDTVPVRSMGIAERTPFPRGRAMWTSTLRSIRHRWLGRDGLLLNRRGLLEMFVDRGLTTVCSSSVGGGSHIYSAVFRYPQVEGFWDGFCDGVSDQSMQPHYESVLRRFDAVVPAADLKIPHTAAERFGPDDPVQGPQTMPPTWLGFLFPEQIGQPRKIVDANGIERWEMDYDDRDGHGFLGAPSGAKTTVDFLYLAPLLGRGLDLRDLCEATRLVAEPAGGGARYRVDYVDHRSGEAHALHTDHVVLAAGAMNTLRLLLVSRDIEHTLSGMPQLGRRLGGNGDLFAFWDYNEAGRDLSTGLPFHGGFQLKDERFPHMLTGGGWPAAHHYPLPGFVKERIKRGAFTSSMGIDAMDGNVCIRDGRLRIDFDPDHSPIYAEIKATFRRMSEVTGKRIYYPRNPITVHALGGARLDRDIDHGVVGASGEIYGQPGLFIADGAVFPQLPGGPPTLAIAAWAEHVGAGLGERLRAEVHGADAGQAVG
ncbi:MAG: GMC family oxidoreductase [Gammaproteobacteria bacterium]|nr:GMC family oxidoreductase [Gammaproteobacteria bacterium]MCP5201464.1 GMC family oxidoreductase [Gammaproteobacteria bacterium]